MPHRSFLVLILAFSALLVGPRAWADTGATMDLEILGALAGYRDLPVPIPTTFYVEQVPGRTERARTLRRSLLPAAGAAGHNLGTVQTAIETLRTDLAAKGLAGRRNNPHWAADKKQRLGLWRKVEAELIRRLNGVIRAANLRGNRILGEHGVTSYRSLERTANDARARLVAGGRTGLGIGDKPPTGQAGRILSGAKADALRTGGSELARSQAPSFAGRWEREGSGWGLVTLQLTSGRKLTGTWSGGKDGRRLNGTLQADGKTFLVTYTDKGRPQPTKYKFRLAGKGRTLNIWSSYLNNKSLARK